MLPPGEAVVFLLVHQCLFGVYLGSVFAPNHKGMPVLRGDERPDFLRRQVLTSRDVRGGRFTDIVLGGLNYQIEHHLFPSMPSPPPAQGPDHRPQVLPGARGQLLGDQPGPLLPADPREPPHGRSPLGTPETS
ncbi:hypothetical protein GCM10020254_79300 [Streptomyces goshikiensis]